MLGLRRFTPTPARTRCCRNRIRSGPDEAARNLLDKATNRDLAPHPEALRAATRRADEVQVSERVVGREVYRLRWRK
jgi:hypothetical protein